jgi:hypothetical protein
MIRGDQKVRAAGLAGRERKPRVPIIGMSRLDLPMLLRPRSTISGEGEPISLGLRPPLFRQDAAREERVRVAKLRRRRRRHPPVVRMRAEAVRWWWRCRRRRLA